MNSPHEELAAAIAAERAAWARVKDKLPGSPGYEPALWEQWRETVSRCHAVRAALRTPAAGPADGASCVRSPGAGDPCSPH
ncbi:hypothetical protein JJB11_13270 [Ramlibacter ginsenosidimutans]|uniref:Uncharacterized protein n=1 Tax=Ramlibacter ginsenosidimutans TaxID=502333 RepID=A0A934TU55_9BURK|nr:hypothetical protein [Ramlibacter ginsenosidimutans]MBK6007066.1 hypothetical protein [Ramlibacter ginsenosidimutans]